MIIVGEVYTRSWNLGLIGQHHLINKTLKLRWTLRYHTHDHFDHDTRTQS